MFTHKLLHHLRLVSLFGLVAVVAAGCGGTREAALPAAASDPAVVAVVGDEVLTLTEFEDRYAKSVGGVTAASDDSLGAYQDFLERYVNFLLKVRAAEDAGLNEDPALRAEIADYRTNLAKPYLLEQEVIEPIIRDLYRKQQEMIDASHILIRLPAGAPPADTLTAYERMEALVDSLAAGVDFGRLAFRHSEDPSASGRPNAPGFEGRLGFFSGGRLVEEFENVAYDTPVGAVSGIFRTQFGYHILKVHDRMAAVPDVNIAHLMVTPDTPTPADSAAAAALITDLQARLAAGEDFAALARQYSDDQQSAANGGDLGMISYGMPIVASFKDAAFALENPGDVSEVVETPFGFHLLKLISRDKATSYEEAYPELKQTAARMPRAQRAERQLAEQIRAQQGDHVERALLDALVAPVSQDSVLIVLSGRTFSDSLMALPVASVGDSTYTLRTLTDFARNARVPTAPSKAAFLDSLIELYLNERAITYEAARLEERDDDFRAIMSEFRDGLLLFRLMEDSVWTAAERDSLALVDYHAGRAERYRFPERTRIITLRASTDSVLAAAAGRLDAGDPLQAVLASLEADSTNSVRVDTTLIAGETNSVYDRALPLAPGQYAGPASERRGFILLFNDGIDPARQKTFEEARTEVIGDYQKILEDRMINRLRSEYRVRVFPERLARAFVGASNDETAAATE